MLIIPTSSNEPSIRVLTWSVLPIASMRWQTSCNDLRAIFARERFLGRCK
ncbi:hypothetical protein [Microcoleus sp. S13_C3]